jgi:hypothetical protein
MGRKSQGVESFKHLSAILDTTGGASAKKIGKMASNTSNYLSGAMTPGKKVLSSALRHALEWEVKPIVEVGPIDHAKSLSSAPGIYSLYDSSGSVIYVGQATNLKQEVAQALNRKMNFPVRHGPTLSKKAHPKYKIVATHISAYEVHSRRMRHNLEALLLRVFPNQSHNNKMGTFR